MKLSARLLELLADFVHLKFAIFYFHRHSLDNASIISILHMVHMQYIITEILNGCQPASRPF